MKSKIITYFLITAVLSIWSIVLYRIFFSKEPETVDVVKSQKRPERVINQPLLERNVQLALNYRDPFLNKDFKQKTVVANKSMQIQKMVSVEIINWAAVKYTGYIQNPQTGNLTSMLRINNKDYMLSDGDSAEGFKLIKNYKESVLVGWKKQKKHIKL